MGSSSGTRHLVFHHTLVEFWAFELVVILLVSCPCARNMGGHVDVCRQCGALMDSRPSSLVLDAGEM